LIKLCALRAETLRGSRRNVQRWIVGEAGGGIRRGRSVRTHPRRIEIQICTLIFVCVSRNSDCDLTAATDALSLSLCVCVFCVLQLKEGREGPMVFVTLRKETSVADAYFWATQEDR